MAVSKPYMTLCFQGASQEDLDQAYKDIQERYPFLIDGEPTDEHPVRLVAHDDGCAIPLDDEDEDELP